MFYGVPLPSATTWEAPPPPRRRPGDPPPPATILAGATGVLLLLAVLAATILTIEERAAASPVLVAPVTEPAAPSAPAAPAASAAPPTPADDVPAAYPAAPEPIPAALLTQLEAASDAPLATELRVLLEAIQSGFGASSVQLEPTLRSYAYRMASRFEWNPDAYRIAVTAPDAGLAEARAATLNRLFQTAVAAGRLDIRARVGPHALSLVTE